MPLWPDSGAISSPKVRALESYWTARLDGGVAPLRARFDPIELRGLLPNIVLVDVDPATLAVRYRLVGTQIVEVSQVDFTGRYLDELDVQVSERRIWAESYNRVVATAAPVFGRTAIPLADGSGGSIPEEFGIFPLSHDGMAISQCIAVEDYDLDRYVTDPAAARPTGLPDAGGTCDEPPG